MASVVMRGDEERPCGWKSSVDRGWAWMCLLGVFLVNLIAIGTFKSLGIIYVEAMERFHTSAGYTAWIFTCIGITTTILPTPAAALSNRFGNRSVVIVGGFVFACGSVFTSFTTTITQMILVFGLLSGAGLGMVFGNSLSMIPKYFERRRALASGLAVSGSSIGQFVVPPLLRYLLDVFGFRGAMLIYGALLLHLCLCGSTYRPLRFNQLVELQRDGKVNVNSIELDENKPSATDKDNVACMKDYPTGEPENENLLKSSECGDGKSCSEFDSSITNQPQETRNEERPKEHEASLPENDKNVHEEKLNSKACCLGTLLDFSLFKEHKFIVYLLGTWLATAGYANAFMIIPPHAKQLNISKQQTAVILSLTGAGDLIGRIAIGFISDTAFVKRFLERHHIYLICIGTVGVAHLLCPLAVTQAALTVYCVLLGFFGGGFISLMVVVLADWVGAARINSATGFTLMVQGFGNVITPLILGEMRDITGDFTASFRFLGSIMVAGSLVFLIGPYIATSKRKDNYI